MQRIAVIIAVLALLSGQGVCLAEPAIPNLVGTWNVKAEGGVIQKGKAVGPKTHHAGEFSTLTAEAIITKQQGRVVHGTFKSAKATEQFVAVIGLDNKSVYYADEDGMIEGKMADHDTIEVVYRHISATDTVVAVGTWTRKK